MAGGGGGNCPPCLPSSAATDIASVRSALVLHHSFIDTLLTVGVILQSKVCLQAFNKWSDLVQLIVAFIISLTHGSITIKMQVPQDFLKPGS